MSNYAPISKISTTLTNRVVTHITAKGSNFSIDPLTILAIINCIIGLARLLYECYVNRSQDVYYDKVTSPGTVSRYLMRRYISKHFDFKTKAERKIVYESMLAVASSMSQSEINKLIESVKDKE